MGWNRIAILNSVSACRWRICKKQHNQWGFVKWLHTLILHYIAQAHDSTTAAVSKLKHTVKDVIK